MSLLLPTLLLAALAASAAGPAECPTKCGDLDIPYPFGIGAACSRSKGFELSCVNNGSMAVLQSVVTHTIPVLGLSVAPLPEAKVILPVAYKCYTSAGNRVITFDGHAGVNKHGDVFRISNARNLFTVLQWNTGGAYNYNMSSDSSMPVWLDWAIRDDDSALSCATAKNSTRYACVSASSECVDSVNGPGYYCRCKQGFEGNPYNDKNVCTKVDECTLPQKYPCYGVCKDTEGSYDCKCRPGYRATSGDPKKERCISEFLLQAQHDDTGGGETYMAESNVRSLPQLWKDWEIRLTVLLSFSLQLFLLFAGSMLRRNIKAVLQFLLWLAYVGADAVSVFGLGLISHYSETKCLLRSSSFGDAQPFLWIPFLLVHLGGQDSITAYSIEDNNLWLRHLLTLGIQGALALYIFWKSIHLMINIQILIPAALTFISGVIKYGERIWALWSGSRESLAKSSKNTESEQSPGQNSGGNMCFYLHPENMNIYSYAYKMVLHARGLFIGRTVLQLGDRVPRQFENNFSRFEEGDKHKIIVMELAMMFDLLYTEARVLQKMVGRILRFSAQIFMVSAFVIFLISDKHVQNHDRINIGITYTLFIGAIFMEVCSIAMVITSLWTRAHLREGCFLHWLFISNACSTFMAIKWNNIMPQWLPHDTISIGQFNHINCISHFPTSKVLCGIISAFGLGEHWKNLRFVKRVNSDGVVQDIERWFNRTQEFQWRRVNRRRLNYTLCLPFEHALYRLHIFTDLHISRHFDNLKCKISWSDDNELHDVMQLKEDCEKVSNYMYYLNQVLPSMLPVSVAVHDGTLPRREGEPKTKLELAEEHAKQLRGQPDAECPFDPVVTGQDLKASLEDIKEMWTRLLVYAAGKCGGELHARQLGKGGELLSFVWLLMLHHGLGDAATEYKLLISDDRSILQPGTLVSAAGNNWRQLGGPRYAFDFRQSDIIGIHPFRDARLLARARIIPLSQSGGPSEGDGGGTSRQAERHESDDDTAQEIH